MSHYETMSVCRKGLGWLALAGPRLSSCLIFAWRGTWQLEKAHAVANTRDKGMPCVCASEILSQSAGTLGSSTASSPVRYLDYLHCGPRGLRILDA